MSGPPKRIRLLNGLGRALSPMGLAPRAPDAEVLISRAERSTGLQMAAADPFRGFFSSAIAGANEGAGLSPFGRWGVPRLAERMVSNHLRLTDVFERRPELADVPVERPVLVVGRYRSGTTMLHRLLAQAEGARNPRAWELYFPVPELEDAGADARLRRARMDRMLRLAHFAIPSLRKLHTITADDPEEATVLLDNAGLGVYFMHAFGAHEHGRRLVEGDTSFAYRSLLRQLQLLATTGGGGRWILKCPFSYWKLDEFLAVFPDAQIVHIRRDRRDTLASICRLATALQHSFRRRVDPTQIEQFWSTFYSDGRERLRTTREALGSERFVDVAFEDLVAAPDTVMDRLQT